MDAKRSASSAGTPSGSDPKKAKVETGGDEESYWFRVTVRSGEPNTFRVIHAGAHHTLHDLHTTLLNAVSFEETSVSAFFLNGQAFSKEKDTVFHSDLTGKKPFMKERTLKSLHPQPGQRWLYLFDFGNPVEFDVVVEKVHATKPLSAPVVTAQQGQFPAQDKGDDANEEFEEEESVGDDDEDEGEEEDEDEEEDEGSGNEPGGAAAKEDEEEDDEDEDA